MGAGASFEGAGHLEHDGSRYFCHSCRRIFAMSSPPVGMNCPYCQSTFLEEFGPGNSRVQGRDLRIGLSDEQARRLNNAATLLQILEAQFREELDSLQTAFMEAEARKVLPLSKRMLESLVIENISVDMICDQPSCPICNENYILGESVTVLPCKHVYHRPCVIPWLNMKRTCPICRFELVDTVPTIEELLRYNAHELIEKLHAVNITSGLEGKNKLELAQLLHAALLKQRDDMEAEAAASIAAEPDAGEEPAPTDEEEEDWRQALEDERNADEAMRLEAQHLARLQTLANIATSNSGSRLSLSSSGISYPAETYSHRLLYGERDINENNNNMYNVSSLNNLREESKTQDTLTTTPSYYTPSGFTQPPRRLSDNNSNTSSSYSINTMVRQHSNTSTLSMNNGSGLYNNTRNNGEIPFPTTTTGSSSSTSFTYGPTLGGIPMATYSTLALTQDEPNFFPINHYRSSSITSNHNNNNTNNNYRSESSRNNSTRSSAIPIPVSVSRERTSLTAPDNID